MFGICVIPCCDCPDYSKCIPLGKSRCTTCRYYQVDVLEGPCRNCRGFDLVHKDCQDLYVKKE